MYLLFRETEFWTDPIKYPLSKQDNFKLTFKITRIVRSLFRNFHLFGNANIFFKSEKHQDIKNTGSKCIVQKFVFFV